MAFIALVPILAFGIVQPVLAMDITDASVDIRNDFVIGPAKTDVIMNPGEKVTRTLSIVNRTDREQTFTIGVEDFTGSRDVKQAVVLLGKDKGPYSLKDYIKPEVSSVKLGSKQRAVLNVDISVPADATPGGLYGSVLVSSEPSNTTANVDNTSKTISRIGALYFVRVAGAVKEDARVTDFRMAEGKTVYEKGPFNFEVLFENNSSVHLTPSGNIEIKNMLGKKVKDLEISSFFSMPDSLRSTQVSWDSSFAFGRYSATASVNRGYQESPDQTDVLTLSFWVLPWKIVVGFIIVILIIFFVLRKVFRSFEIKRK